MNTTYLNPVEIKVGTKITFTELGMKNIKNLKLVYPEKFNTKVYEIVSVIDTMAEDEHTELLEPTVGATALKDTSNGEILAIDASNEEYWAFFTNHTPHLFNVV